MAIKKQEIKDMTGWVELKYRQPKKDIWVLAETPYCSYPAEVAKWNGVSFISPDKAEVMNVEKWKEI